MPVVALFSVDGDGITNERVYLDLGSFVGQIGRPELRPQIGNARFAAAEMR